MPNFWCALVLVLIVSAQLNWLPAIGYQAFANTIPPGTAIAIELSPIFMRALAVSIASVTRQNFIQLEDFLLNFGRVLSSSTQSETLASEFSICSACRLELRSAEFSIKKYTFAYPGFGLLTVQAVSQRDFPVIQRCGSAIHVAVCRDLESGRSHFDLDRSEIGFRTTAPASTVGEIAVRSLALSLAPISVSGEPRLRRRNSRSVLFCSVLLVGAALINRSLSSQSATTKISIMAKFTPPVFMRMGKPDRRAGHGSARSRSVGAVNPLIGLQNALTISLCAVVIMFAGRCRGRNGLRLLRRLD